jgi:sulfhydrogenase subunit alpha
MADRPARRTIETKQLARVEGEGAMRVLIRDGEVADVELQIYEPPRFFEAFLRGRSFLEAPDITARICGICPVAYQMSACLAMEDACGVVVDGPIRDLRRLLYCGEWIESHALHIFLLHAPDFLGYDGAVDMAKDHRELVETGLALKKAGNQLMAVVGGREVHPINVRVGGFYRSPSRAELAPLVDPLERARESAAATVRLAASLEFPELEWDGELVALSSDGEYAIDRGRFVSAGGLDFAAAEFDDYVV